MLSATEIDSWNRDGFVMFRKVFSPFEMAELDAEANMLFARVELMSRFNLRCRYMPHWETGELLFEVFDPVNDIGPVCARMSADRRIVEKVEAIYREAACLFKDKLIFKPAGATGYRLHQDIPLGWAGFPQSFLSVLIPIDSQNKANGCTEVFSGYHHRFLSDKPENYMLPDDTVDEARRTYLELEPGDVAIFHGLTPHRSAPNKTDGMRRSLFLSFNKRSEGGDQRAAHYAEFQQKMRQRFSAEEQPQVFFR